MKTSPVRHIAEMKRDRKLPPVLGPDSPYLTLPAVRSRDPLFRRLVGGRKPSSMYVSGTFPYIFTVRVKRPLLALVLARTTTPAEG
jgi:hypothetical protein